MPIQELPSSSAKEDGHFVLGTTTVSGPSSAVEAARLDALELANQAYFLEGPSAFDSPRSAAITHEAGHVVVFEHFGLTVTRAKVWKEKGGAAHGQWSGFTWAGSNWCSDCTSDPNDDFRQACCTIAEVMAEQIFDRVNFRAASSIDEIVVAQGLASNISHKLGSDYEGVMAHVMFATCDILHRNAELTRLVAAELGRRGVVRKKKLAEFLLVLDRTPSKFVLPASPAS